MSGISLFKKFRDVRSYVLPAVAAASGFWVLLQAKYDEGWADAMGCDRQNGCRLGEFSYLEYGILGALVFSASFSSRPAGRGRGLRWRLR